MKTLEMPVFNNSCGKIFNDKIVLASAHREDEIDLEDIKKLKFGVTTSLKTIMWTLLPSSIFVLLYMERRMLDSAMFFLLAFVSIAITVVSLVMAEKSYFVLIKMHDGFTVRIRVAVDNKKDAKKFTDMCNKKLAKSKREDLRVVRTAA